MPETAVRRELITQAAYAERRGCTVRAVEKAVAEGRIPVFRGKVDPVLADQQWAATTRARGDSRPASSAAVPPPAPAKEPETVPPGVDYNAARARRELADAQKAEFEVLRQSGRLVERERVEAAVFEAFRVLRDRILAVPRRCAPTLVNVASVRDIELAIADELRRALGADEALAVGAIVQKATA